MNLVYTKIINHFIKLFLHHLKHAFFLPIDYLMNLVQNRLIRFVCVQFMVYKQKNGPLRAVGKALEFQFAHNPKQQDRSRDGGKKAFDGERLDRTDAKE